MSIETSILSFANIASGVSTAFDKIVLGHSIKGEAEARSLSVADMIESVKRNFALTVSEDALARTGGAIDDINGVRFRGLSRGAVFKSASAYEFFLSARVNVDSFPTGRRNILAHLALQICQQRSLVELASVIAEWADSERADAELLEAFLTDEHAELTAARRAKAKQPKQTKSAKPAVSSDDKPQTKTPAASVSSDDTTEPTDVINQALKAIRATVELNADTLTPEDITEYARELRALSKLLTAIHAN